MSQERKGSKEILFEGLLFSLERERGKKKEEGNKGGWFPLGSFYRKVKRKHSAKNTLHLPTNRSTNLKEILFKKYHNPKSCSNLPHQNRLHEPSKSRSSPPTANATPGVHKKGRTKI